MLPEVTGALRVEGASVSTAEISLEIEQKVNTR